MKIFRALAKSNAAFTLIEVTIAILILASSLTVLLGLQSSSVQRTIRDQHRQQAMLMARQILAAIESAEDPPQVGRNSGTAREMLDLMLNDHNIQGQRNGPADDFMCEVAVDNWQVPGLEGNVMRRLTVTISWSDSPNDSLNIYYFFAPEFDEER